MTVYYAIAFGPSSPLNVPHHSPVGSEASLSTITTYPEFGIQFGKNLH